MNERDLVAFDRRQRRPARPRRPVLNEREIRAALHAVQGWLDADAAPDDSTMPAMQAAAQKLRELLAYGNF